MAYKLMTLNSLHKLMGTRQNQINKLMVFEQRRFTVAKALMKQQHMSITKTHKLEDNNGQVMTQADSENKNTLAFVKQHPNLRQIFIRAPSKSLQLSLNIGDGIYPNLKKHCDYEIEDLQILIKNNQTDEITEVIKAISVDSKSSNPQFISFLAAKLHDKSSEQMSILYQKIKEIEMPISSLVMNYMLQNAAFFQQYSQLVQLLIEATICDIQVDLNTYLQVLTKIYFEMEQPFDRKQFIQLVYILFDNDHLDEDFELGAKFLQEFIENNFSEFNATNYKKKKMQKKAKYAKDQQADQNGQPKTDNQEESQELSNGEEDDDYLSQEGILPEDQINDMFQRRGNLYKTQMNRSKNKLKKSNKKMSQNYQSSLSNKHLNKYNKAFDDEFETQTQLVVDIGHLKDIDSSPQNIKELSQMMAGRFEQLLNEELQKINKENPKISDKYQQSYSQQPFANSNDKVLKFDMTSFKKKEGKFNNKPQDSHSKSPNIRDETFSLETFYNAIGENKNKDNRKDQKEEIKQGKEDRQYITTQEDASSEGNTLHKRQAGGAGIQNQEKITYDTDAREDLERKSIIRDEFQENAITDKEKHSNNTSSTSDDREGVPSKK